MEMEILRYIQLTRHYKCVVLLRDSRQNRRLARWMRLIYLNDIDIVYGDVKEKKDCNRFVADWDYVIHCAA